MIIDSIFIIIVFNEFYEQHKRVIAAADKEDIEKLAKVKKDLFEKLKLDEELLSDDYLSE